MEVLHVPFKVLSIFGIWKPDFSSKLDKILSDFSSIIFFPIQFLLTIGLIGRLAIDKLNVDEFAETLFLTLTIAVGTGKSIYYLLQRKHIVKLLNKFLSNCLRPQSSSEQDIHDKYNKISSTIVYPVLVEKFYLISAQEFGYFWYEKFMSTFAKDKGRYVTVTCVLLVETTVMMWLLAPFFQAKNNRSLPFKIWLPFDETPEKIYWFTYVPEALAIVCSSFVGILTDTIVSGFMILTCGQFDLLSHRLLHVSNYGDEIESIQMSQFEIEVYEQRLINQNIRHHLLIYEVADAIRETFQPVIFMQFTASSIVIAVTVYQLSTVESINIEFFSKLFYLQCMLTQFFIYCWFGNELTVKSQEFGTSIFQTNWTALSIKSNKQLLLVIQRTTKPIILSTGHFIVLSANSFTTILKASYTAFNVLRSSSIKN